MMSTLAWILRSVSALNLAGVRRKHMLAQIRQNGAAAWKAARDNVRAQLEHQANRVVNLELAESFSEHAWRRHVRERCV